MIYRGDIAVDNRGTVTFINDFDFKDVKRFYIVKNSKNRFFRGWHGHKKEGKYVFVIRGRAIIAWQSLELQKGMQYGAFTVLDASKPEIVFIPPGYANAAMNLTKDTEIMYFSTATLPESKLDDLRFPKEKWDASYLEDIK